MDYKEEYAEETTQTVETNYQTERNKPMPSRNHAAIQLNIGFLLKSIYRKKYRAFSELTLNLSDWISVPDISIFPYSKYDASNDQIKVTESPLCVMEILSPTQTQSELISKTRQYFENGVKSVWVVFPELENVYVFSSSTDYEIFRKGQILKDLTMEIEMNVDEIFE